MDRTVYNSCVKPYISGQHEDRKRDFCIGAKICSGKASDEEEAGRLCAEAAANPKPPRAKKGRGNKIDAVALATCIIDTLDGTELTRANLVPIIAGCTGQKIEKVLTRESFIKKCFKENAITGDIKESQKLRSMCTAKWKEQEGL